LAYILASKPVEVDSLKKKLPPWMVIIGITGGHILPGERMKARENDIRDIARQSGLKIVPAVPGCQGSRLLELLLRPSEKPYWRIRYKGGSQEIFFLTTIDKTPGYITTIYSSAEEYNYPIPDIGIYIQPVHQGVGCHCEFILPFEPGNQVELSGVKELFHDASRRVFRQGAYFSRPYGIWARMVYNADAQTMAVTQKIKKIFDPHNVMNPGKLCF
jgi:hypothetical protein